MDSVSRRRCVGATATAAPTLRAALAAGLVDGVLSALARGPCAWHVNCVGFGTGLKGLQRIPIFYFV
jgi:hypothetical protein